MATNYITRSGQVTIIDLQDIDHITVYYLATSASENITWNTLGWTTTIQSIDLSNPYLWSYQEAISGKNEVINRTEPVIIGVYGPQGIQGEQGVQGVQGPAGQDGYTPIKNVDYFDGTPGQDGQDGAYPISITVLYCLTSVPPTSDTSGTANIPIYTQESYTSGASYYRKEITTLSDTSIIETNWELDGSLTSANRNAFLANQTAQAAQNTVLAQETEIDALQAQAKHFIYNETGAIVATGIDANTYNPELVSTYGYNAITAPGYIGLRYNDANLMQLTTAKLTFYVPRTNATDTAIKMLELSAADASEETPAGLRIYNPSSLNQELMTLSNNALSFKDLTGNILASFGSNGTIQSGNFEIDNNAIFSTHGTKIDLSNGEIFSKYFRVSDSQGDSVENGAYIQGRIEAFDGKIGSSNSNYWYIGNFIDSYEANSALIKSYGSAQIQLGNNLSWRLATDRLHTAWTDENAIDNPYYLRFPRDNQNYYWDSGIHISTGSSSDKFVYIRKSHENNGSSLLENLNANLNDETSNTWDYQFYVDGSGNLYAQNLYAKIDGNWVLVGGANGTYLPLSGGTITGNLTVNGTLTATASNAIRVANDLIIKWGAANTEGTNKFTYNGSAEKTITLGNAAIKDVISSLTNNTSSTDLPTAAAVVNYVGGIINSGITNAGTGLDKNGNTINHSNSITAQTTQAVYPIKIDAQGHISAYGNAITSMPASDVPSWAKAATKPTYNYSEISGTPTALKNPNALQIKIYDGNSNPSTTVSYDGSAANKIANVASNNAIVGLNTTIAEGGVSTFNITKADGSTDSFEVTIVASAASSAETADSLTVGTVGSTSRPVYFSNGIPKQIGYTIQSSVPSGAVFTDTTYTAGIGLSLTGTTFNISTVPIANGGTGQTTARNGFHALTGGLTEGTADVTDNTVLMTGNTNAATNDWYYRKASHLYNYIKGKTDTAYLKLTGGTVTGVTQINNILTLYREGTTANNYPAGIQFSVKDTTNNLVDNNAYIYVYDDHATSAYGTNMVIRSGGGMFIGGGESPSAHYSAKGSTYTGEDTFVTTDGILYLQSNGNTIANRLGMAINTAHQLVPIKADTYTNNVGSIGSGSYYWQHIYGTNYHGIVYNISEKAAMHYDSNLDAIVFSFA